MMLLVTDAKAFATTSSSSSMSSATSNIFRPASNANSLTLQASIDIPQSRGIRLVLDLHSMKNGLAIPHGV